ncbi:MAG: polysaccharide deacetylase family protein [Bradymonadia bacterium]
MTGRTASVGVDVDSLHHYYRIHGLSEEAASNAAWTVAVPRFCDLFGRLGIPATFYCIAEDLEIGQNRDHVRHLVSLGHEIGNHSLHHRYDLTKLTGQMLHAEVATSREILSEAAGEQVLGFRAPGYNTNERVISAVFESGHRYDSSVFPCVPYYLAKATIMGLLRMRGRPSKSILGDPRVLLSPSQPYQMTASSPYRKVPEGLRQYPISVFAGCPLIGTAFTALGPSISEAIVRAASRFQRHITLEFHAVDLLAIAEDGLDPQLAVQPDLKVPVAKKLMAFEKVFSAISERHHFVRLDHLSAKR